MMVSLKSNWRHVVLAQTYLLFKEALDQDQLLKGCEPPVPVASDPWLLLRRLVKGRQLSHVVGPPLWIKRCLKGS